MKTSLNLVENYALNAAFAMFLALSVLSALTRESEAITVARDVLFVLIGFSGVMVSGELTALLHARIPKTKKRIIRVAQTLLLAFSLILVGFAAVKLGLLTSLVRWD